MNPLSTKKFDSFIEKVGESGYCFISIKHSFMVSETQSAHYCQLVTLDKDGDISSEEPFFVICDLKSDDFTIFGEDNFF